MWILGFKGLFKSRSLGVVLIIYLPAGAISKWFPTTHCWPAPQTKLNSDQVRLRNVAEIFVLCPLLSTRI